MEIVIFGGFICFIVITFLCRKRKVIRHQEHQKQGIVIIKQLKKIITFVQQHRGLNAALLNGDNKVANKITLLKRQINDEITLLKLTDINKNERWVAFIDHWARLSNINENKTVQNSFEQHTMMVRNLAYLLEDIAETFYLTSDYVEKISNIDYVWRELVLATENVGQSRAIGTGIAVRKFCSNVDKIRLSFLIQTMTETTQTTLKHLSFLPDEQSAHDVLVTKATDKMNNLIQVMSQDIVEATKINLDNASYFDLATETMATMNDIFEHQMRQLARVI